MGEDLGCCVSILASSTSIYRPRGALGCLGSHKWGGDTWHWGVGAKLVNLPWGAAGFRRNIRAGTWHRFWQADTWKGGERGLKVGLANLGGSANLGVAPFMPLFVQVGPKVGMRVLTVFRASDLVVVGPLIRVLCSWLVESVLLWINDVSCPRGLLCGSTSPCGLVWVPPGPHDIFCISLLFELQSSQMIYPFRSSRRARCNGAELFGIWGCLWWCHIYAIGLLALNCIIQFHVHFDVSCNKR
jgi:hypothetical protein